MQCKCNYIEEFLWSYSDINVQAFEYSRNQDVILLNLLAEIDFVVLSYSVTHCDAIYHTKIKVGLNPF